MFRKIFLDPVVSSTYMFRMRVQTIVPCDPLSYQFSICSIPEEGDGVEGNSSRHIFSYKIVSGIK